MHDKTSRYVEVAKTTEKKGENWLGMGQLGRLLGVSAREAHRLHQKLGRPAERRIGRGQTCRIEVDSPRWLAAWAATGEASDYRVALARWKRAQADREEYKARQLGGELIAVAEHVRWLEMILGHMRDVSARLCTNCQTRYSEGYDELEHVWKREAQRGNSVGESDGAAALSSKAAGKH